MKLERFARDNGLNGGRAHEAMSDVDATTHLARLIEDKAPDVWKIVTRSLDRTEVWKFMQKHLVFASARFYFSRPVVDFLTFCRQPEGSNNVAILFDVTCDPKEFIGYSIDAMVDIMGRNGFVRETQLNKLLILIPLPHIPEESMAESSAGFCKTFLGIEDGKIVGMACSIMD